MIQSLKNTHHPPLLHIQNHPPSTPSYYPVSPFSHKPTYQFLQTLTKQNQQKPLQIIHFVNIQQIHPIYYQTTYFLSPHTPPPKPYSLLRKPFQQSA
ncbi:Ku protein, partial [Bacillus altitudinis]|uniref:Ku protein n=1 Tax=Bacillus altitudinis TaxID=293387 RepID=UPI003B5185C2